MPPLRELSSPQELESFLRDNPACLVTFSAHWCGPCQRSKPQLEQMALQQPASLPFAIIYEDVLQNQIHEYRIRAFPTYVAYAQQQEVQRVEGANLPAVQQMAEALSSKAGGMPTTGGETLGGSHATALSPEEARKLRLAALGAGTAGTTPARSSTPSAKPAAGTSDDPMVLDPKVEAAEKVDDDMEDATPEEDPTASLDPELVRQLTEEMGFSLIRAQKGLLHGNNTLESAIEWLTEHQDDPDIDDPIATLKAMSYKCNDCGKILSNMANLELHANKTGHSDFEESTKLVKPLTEDEKKAKIAEIKQLLKEKRAEREEAEKVDRTEQEKQRRMMGKEMAQTREELEKEQRKREIYLRKKEKEDFKKERARIKAELEKDKRERAANQGKLTSKLGVEGYNPSAIQYELEQPTEDQQEHAKKLKVDASKIDQYIEKVSSYRAGGDGGKSLKLLSLFVGNVVDNPDNDKFKSINMQGNAYKTKIKPFVGAKNILLAVGFSPNEDGSSLVLNEDASMEVLAQTRDKLVNALKAYE